MSRLIKCVSIILITIISSVSNAHVDTVFSIDEKGMIKGLPNKYKPAYFDLQKNELKIGKNKIQFPDCISKNFLKDVKYRIYSYGSWYHQKYFERIPSYKGLPDYITIKVAYELEEIGLTYLIDMFLSLEDLTPIKRDYDVFNHSGYGVFVKPINSNVPYLKIGVADECLENLELSESASKDIKIKKEKISMQEKIKNY